MASVARGTQWVKDQTGPMGQRLQMWRPRDLGPPHFGHFFVRFYYLVSLED
ncbi:hypothetical protein Syun_007448 [Stephania yunnanensis]|uniref:Uncharacterized protein n=1 Tax=Stephania yunnanensis TaxID=152371 RepID=A0AAP0PYI7_9MAGN